MDSDKNSMPRLRSSRRSTSDVNRRAIRNMGIRRPSNQKSQPLRSVIKTVNDAISWKGWGTLFSLAGLLTVWITLKSFDLSQETHESDRFDKAVTQLASESYSERVAGVQALQEISTSNPERVDDISSVLSAFVEARKLEVSSCGTLWGDVFTAQIRDRFASKCMESNGGVIAVVEVARDGEVIMKQYVPLNARADANFKAALDSLDPITFG
jgi:hypothetical protein